MSSKGRNSCASPQGRKGDGEMIEKNPVDMAAKILLLLGGLNWGVMGVASVNVLGLIFGSIPLLLSLIYIVVGLAAVYDLYVIFVKK